METYCVRGILAEAIRVGVVEEAVYSQGEGIRRVPK